MSKSKDPRDSEGEIIHFPDIEARKKREADKKAAEKARKKADEEKWRAEYHAQKSGQSAAERARVAQGRGGHEPFFNFGGIPPFTKYFAGALIAIHIIMSFIVPAPYAVLADLYLGFVPAHFTTEFTPFALLSPLTHTLLHGSWMHLGFNCVMLLALGKFFETEFGTRRMINLFVLSALGGALLHFISDPFATMPVVGASGGISGLFGAMLMIFYQRGMIGAMGKKGPVGLIAFWLVLLIVMGLIGGPNTAWIAHIGGFLSGLIYLSWIQRRSLIFWRV